MSAQNNALSLKKPIIAVDIDEVLAPFVPLLIEFYNKNYLLEDQKPLTLELFHNYHFRHVWGGTEERSTEIVNAFLDSDLFINQPIIDEKAVEVLQHLSKQYDLVIVTSRQHKIRDQTEKLLNTHFPNIFSEIRMGNHYGEEGHVASKPEMCKELGAVLLIDDSLKYCQQCKDEGIPSILFGNYAWNYSEEVIDEYWIKRINSWNEMEEAILTMLKKHKHL
ncbi:hypothetical protein ABK040_011553 [Willaertia magna]